MLAGNRAGEYVRELTKLILDQPEMVGDPEFFCLLFMSMYLNTFITDILSFLLSSTQNRISSNINRIYSLSLSFRGK